MVQERTRHHWYVVNSATWVSLRGIRIPARIIAALPFGTCTVVSTRMSGSLSLFRSRVARVIAFALVRVFG